MKNRIFSIIAITTFCLVLPGFTNSVTIKIPTEKIIKSIKKLDLGYSFELVTVVGVSNPMSQSEVMKIQSDTSILGYVYISRLNSCRANGCDAGNPFEEDKFEFFDYFMITDKSGQVIRVKVYNYQATHGHQVMSRGWLKQFIGYTGYQSLGYGQEIEAISGATISAKAITSDIQQAEKIIRSIIEDQ